MCNLAKAPALPASGCSIACRRNSRGQASMPIAKSVLDTIGKTPLIRLQRASEATGCEILGKAEFLNPGQSVKDRAALWIVRAAERDGLAAARRHDRRGHRGQHRHRPVAGRQGARLPLRHRHPRHAVGREEARPAPRRRRADRGAGRALQEPEQLREAFGPARGAARARRCRAARSGRTSSTTSPTGRRISNRPARRSGSDRRQDRRLRLRRRHRRHARRRRHVPEGAQPEHQDRPCRRARRGALQFLRARRAEGRRLVHHRRHRPGPRHRQPRGRARRYRVGDPGRGIGRARSSSWCDEGLGDGRLDRRERRRRDPHGARARAGPHDRHGALRLRQSLRLEAVQSGIPAIQGSAGAASGWRAAPRSKCPFEEAA